MKRTIIFRTERKHKTLRNELMSFPYCFWCNKKVRDDYPYFIENIKKGTKYPHDMATIDHLFPRPIFNKRVINGTPKVLACYSCNHKRGLKTKSMV